MTSGSYMSVCLEHDTAVRQLYKSSKTALRTDLSGSVDLEQTVTAQAQLDLYKSHISQHMKKE